MAYSVLCSKHFKTDCHTHAPNLHSCTNNPQGALSHPQVVKEYLQIEIELERAVGPYIPTELPGTHISRFDAIPKRNQTNKWRLIIDLSYPKGHSINDGICQQNDGM